MGPMDMVLLYSVVIEIFAQDGPLELFEKLGGCSLYKDMECTNKYGVTVSPRRKGGFDEKLWQVVAERCEEHVVHTVWFEGQNAATNKCVIVRA